MLNLDIGTAENIDGKTCILTRQGQSGHAIYGPYRHLDTGRYVVEFNLEAKASEMPGGEDVCAIVDVAAGFGQLVLASEQIRLSGLRRGPVTLRLPFQTEAPHSFEFRVATTGKVPLLIEDHCRVVKLDGMNTDPAVLFEATRFPEPEASQEPVFFRQNLPLLRRLHEDGAIVRIIGPDVVVAIDGVSFYARVIDDLRFVDEIFFRSTYNFSFGTECCVVDIGTNIGLVALTFARKAEVKEVYTFEPFRGTYDRARANFGLNPIVAAKITPHNFGLAGEDEEATILIGDMSDSGALSIRGAVEGVEETISVRNAAAVLGPVFARARSLGRAIVAKVDCEGSEFPIFKVLEDAGLLSQVSAFMVEWHRGIEGKTQRDLLDPLVKLGFLVFDLTGKTGNGFFYAVRAVSK